MASITERRNQDGSVSYRAEVRLKGHPAQRATFARRTDAKRWAQATESAIRDGRYFKTREAQKHTIADMLDRYEREVVALNVKSAKEKTLLRRYFDFFRVEIGAYTLADTTPAMIAACRDKLLTQSHGRSKKPLAPATVSRYLSGLSRAYSVAVREWGWLEDSPMPRVNKPSLPRGRVRFLSEDEIVDGVPVAGERSRLLHACAESSNPYLYTVVVLALSTGMRQGEIMNLRWKDIDLHAGRATLHETKNGERRVVPLAGKALELLKGHSRVRRLDTDLVFPGKTLGAGAGSRGYKPMDLRAPWKAALKKAEIQDFKFHDLRHSAASYLAMNGASLVEIASILGHRTLEMVKRYAHLSEQHTAGVIERMNNRVFGNAK